MATLVGTVFAHRVFDLVPAMLLVVCVLLTAKIPHWALTSIAIVARDRRGLFAFAFITRGIASASSTSSAACGGS